MKYIEPLFRPPAEADSLIFQVAYGCPHNRCRFCGMYKGVRYRLRPEDEVLTEIAGAARRWPDTRRIFLADGDVMALPFDRLAAILDALTRAFPKLSRVNLYANGSSVMNRSEAQLRELRQLKLNTLYMGLESGSQEVLDLFGKTERVDEMIAAVVQTQLLGFKSSVMILVGLGGALLSSSHAAETVAAVNRMQPRLLSALRYVEIPGMTQPEGYVTLSEYEAVAEMRRMVAGFALDQTVFRANHSSNPLPLAGRFPADQARILAELDAELASGELDRRGPGRLPLFL
ncbi:MAG: radical SAM protein [Victivallaceae bacterium]